MRKFKLLVPAAGITAGLILTSGKSAAKPDFTKKERKSCEFCHTGSWTSGQYTDAGVYYRDHHTFKGYQPPKDDGESKSVPSK